MSIPQISESNLRTPLRLWPGVVIVTVQWLLWLVAPLVAPDAEVFSLPVGFLAVLAGALGGILVVLWWLLFSRAPWAERLGAVLLMVIALPATRLVVHESISGAGMGMLLYLSAIPGLSLALVGWAVATRHLGSGARRALLVAAVAIACVPWVLVRTAGVIGGGSEYHWRWTPTPEQRLLAQGDLALPAPPPAPPSADVPPEPAAVEAPAASSAPAVGLPAAGPEPAAGAAAAAPTTTAPATTAPATTAPDAPVSAIDPAVPADAAPSAEWPGFRGPGRDSIVRGVRIDTDWSRSPPVELWRRPIGPGWSSFAVRRDLVYTQEQRGDDEIVACYRLSTGEPVWGHRDPVRFWESNGGAGPRATPTIHEGRVYAFGATGILNALDADTGRVVWSRNVATDTGRKVPDWGFSSSPLVVDRLVVVAAAGTLVAYDLDTGDKRWTGPSYGGSYSSPHRATLDGVPQIVLLGGPGAISVAPADGAVLWKQDWVPGAIVQPALTADGDILVTALAVTGGMGTRRLHVRHGSDGWRMEERWTSNGLKPYFNDYVVHEGHAFGFDGNILASIDLADGRRVWKGGRYGNGQLLLLADQDVLLVISEEGELALVSATPDRYRELARFPALNAKTWNHPVIAGDVLLVRNGEEMAAFRLPVIRR